MKPMSLVEKKIIDLTTTDAIKFSFQGESSACIILEQTFGNSKTVYRIVIGGFENTRSIIERNKETKYTSFEKNLTSISDFRKFWLSWKSGSIEVGRGLDLNNSIFMGWSDTDFQTITDISVQSLDDKEGYWRFPVIKGILNFTSRFICLI